MAKVTQAAQPAPAPAPSTAPFAGTQLKTILAGMMLTLLLVALDQTILTAATPQIVANLNGFDRYAWVSTAYLLTSTVAVPIFGKLADLYGRKGLFLLGISVFLIASLLCGLANLVPIPLDGMNQLIAFRALQGFAGGIMTSVIFIMIGDIFPPAIRGRYQGLFAGVWLLAGLVGPTAGGWLAQSASWRWVFFLNIPVGLLAALFIYVAFPALAPRGARRSIDFAGIGALSAGLVALMLALTWIPDDGWLTSRVLVALGLATLLTALFIAVETRAPEPVIPLSMFRSSIFTVASISIVLTSVGAYGVIIYLPLFMQQVMGISAAGSGGVLTPAIVMLIVGNVGGGLLVAHFGRYKWLTVIGIAFMTLGALISTGIGAGTSAAVLVGSLICIAIGLGITTPLYTVIAQNATPYSQLGVVTAFTQFIRQLGVILGVAVTGSLLLDQYRTLFRSSTPSGVSADLLVPFNQPLHLRQHMTQLRAQFASQPRPGLLHILLRDSSQALTTAVDRAFLLCTVVLAATVALNFFLREIPLRKANVDAKPAGEEKSATITPRPVEEVKLSSLSDS